MRPMKIAHPYMENPRMNLRPVIGDRGSRNLRFTVSLQFLFIVLKCGILFAVSL